MSDYEVDICEFSADYGPVIASEANREVDNGFEIRLSTITVRVKLTSPGYDCSSRTFDVVFTTDHEANAVEFHRISDAYDKHSAFDPSEIMLATEVAGKAVAGWLDDVDVPYTAPEHAITVPTADSDPVVHTDLTVMPDE